MLAQKRFLLFAAIAIFMLSCIIIAAKNVYAVNLKSFILKPVPIPKNNPQTKEKIKLGKVLFLITDCPAMAVYPAHPAMYQQTVLRLLRGFLNHILPHSIGDILPPL